VPTSGSFDYSRTAAQLITIALENVGVLAAGGSVASADTATCLTRLNLIAKAHSGTADFSRGLKNISRQRASLVLQKGQQTYLIGPASTDDRSSILMGHTTISADEAAAQTVISITSNTDTTSYPGTTITMAASDIVGIELNDGTIHFSTISGTPAATMTIAAQLTAAASAGNNVFWFTARAQRMVLVETAVLRDENNKDTPLRIYRTVEEYEAGVADKFADGDPTAILIEPLRLNTKVTLNSQPTDVSKRIVFTGLYPQEDYDNASGTDDIAFPQEALRFLGWELTFEIWETYQGQTPWPPSSEKKRTEARETYFNLNPEVSSAYFRPGGV
jgi:hypothetical protein